jgi:hypothetical protein
MSRRYLLLHRAILNAGDSLIFERARRLIADVHPTAELAMAEAWRPLEAQVSRAQLATYSAVVICGGPGYGPGMAGRYPIGRFDDLPPVALLALGSYVVPGTAGQLARPWLGDDDRRFLEGVLRRTPWLGARDPLSADLLRSSGVDRVLMTGDPAWYDLGQIDEPLRHRFPPARIAVTPPTNPVFFRQAARLFEAVERSNRGASIMVVHHRGVLRPFADLARRRGWQQLDITGGATGFEAYDRVDLHVGYRVHAHLYSTSVGTPSYLVAEDSRGLGMLRGLANLGRPAFDVNAGDARLLRLTMRVMRRLAEPHQPQPRWVGIAVGRFAGVPDVADELVERIGRDAAAGFPDHEAARATIRATLPTMRQMIESLP